MKNLIMFTFALILSLNISCNNDDNKSSTTQEEDLAEVNALFKAMNDMVSNITCENSADWKYMAYGVKGCGGPLGYIAYPISIDESKLKAAVIAYTNAEINYNKKWEGGKSDCAYISEPKGVTCVEGKPTFYYDYSTD